MNPQALWRRERLRVLQSVLLFNFPAGYRHELALLVQQLQVDLWPRWKRECNRPVCAPTSKREWDR